MLLMNKLVVFLYNILVYMKFETVILYCQINASPNRVHDSNCYCLKSLYYKQFLFLNYCKYDNNIDFLSL